MVIAQTRELPSNFRVHKLKKTRLHSARKFAGCPRFASAIVFTTRC